jgi:prepilin-type N-terminal cleavage/methylation domain-containing protein
VKARASTLRAGRCSKNHGSGVKGDNTGKGFTLVELAVVIVVLGVMFALVIPRLGELGKADLKRSARHLTGMIRFLKGESQARKAVYRLQFDVNGGHYWAEVLTPTSENTVEFRRLQSVIGSEGSLSGNTTFRDVVVGSHPDDAFIQFNPDGWVEHAMIHLRDGRDRDYTLAVKPLTGDTELHEGYLEER